MIDLNPSDQFSLHIKIDRFLLPNPRSLIRRESESLQLLDSTVEEVLVDGERSTCNIFRQLNFYFSLRRGLTWYFDDGSEPTCIGILEVVGEERRIDSSRPMNNQISQNHSTKRRDEGNERT